MRRLDQCARSALAMVGSTIVLFAAPAARANTTVDLGLVAYGIEVNGTVYDAGGQASYLYTQLLFNPNNPNITFDSGHTIDQVLAQDLGLAYTGTLTYNFPIPNGASGAYSQNVPQTFGSDDPGIASFTATSVNGTIYNGFNNIGATIQVDPTNVAQTFGGILGGASLSFTPGPPTSTTTTVTLTLGTLDGVDYLGEASDTSWETGSPVAAVPEPPTLWLAAAGMAVLIMTQMRRRSSPPCRAPVA